MTIDRQIDDLTSVITGLRASAARGFPRRFRANWTRLQAWLAAAAPQGRQVVVSGTGHNNPGKRPDAVADTILEMVARTQAD